MDDASSTFDLRQAIAAGALPVLPGVWDGLSARVATQAGFTALFSSGMAIAASLGMPDADIYTMTENLDAVRRVREATRLPIVADIDHGYGGALNVIRTVRQFEAAGVAGVIIEDQASPRRCPVCVDDPVTVLSFHEAVARVRAASEARTNTNTLLVARTDASGEEAIVRAEAFAAAGADLIFPVSRTFSTIDEWRACAGRANVPLVACLTPGTWIEREFTPEVMRRVGVGLALLPFHGLYPAIHAMQRSLARVRAGEAYAQVSADYLRHDAFRTFIGFDETMQVERDYTATANRVDAVVSGIADPTKGGAKRP